MPVVSHLVPHIEKHFTSTELIRDIVIGMSDGLTVPFALAAGLSGAVSQGKIVVVAGLAEIAAGSIAMGLGGYLAARTDADHYNSERQREIDETRAIPDEEAAEVSRLFQGWGLNDQQIQPIVTAISADETRWVDFMMRFELGLDQPDPRRALRSAATIAASYVVGGLIPLSPYMLIPDLPRALLLSVCVTLIALFVFGYIKGRFTGLPPLRGGVQTVLIGGMAAAAAFGIAKLFR
ncbi:MAG: VIT1/CCC1 transporter family protein [Acidobacteriota bacterium]|nr:VIT1/CCC1 transporter family protein [Acidobacteriota bacterium]